ncbi:SnoaL-like domain-containing protein [Sphingomonas laterariae]|uniref:SnoaL-like domain-containing protein n=1 Tax=Edaphosphingomonas laterariae TaxID=861865 RepID=A0A239GND1_9SPHN|nr:nuclear transport factor 2 family protein [Sphingomonas laterariae]SNS70709.1 SnoaL-like domain-containing protein [Sphingomonas laterariae]
MAYTLQQLSDFEDIRTLKHRYFRAIDTADMALLTDMFTDDIAVEYRGGGYKVKLEGRENMLVFLANSFNSDCAAMHQGHQPEITLTGDDTAEGIWYLEDIFVNVAHRTRTHGTAIYRDQYRRVDGKWKLARTEYDRVIEFVDTFPADVEIKSNMLAKQGLKPADRTDISNMISWAA